MASALRARNAESSIANISPQSTIMDNFRRDKKIPAIYSLQREDSADQREDHEEEAAHNEPVEGNSSPEVDVHEVKIEETANANGVLEPKKLDVIAAEDPASLPKATIAYGT